MSVSTWNGDTAAKQALDLNGSSSVTLNDHDRYAFRLNDFSFEGWVNFDAFGANHLEHSLFHKKMEAITMHFHMIQFQKKNDSRNQKWRY